MANSETEQPALVVAPAGSQRLIGVCQPTNFMKTITAVQCDSCGKLVDANKTFLVAKTVTLNHHSGDREVTKTHITDGAFCDAGCFTQLVLHHFGMDK